MQIAHSESLLGKNTLNFQARARAFIDAGSDAELEQALGWAAQEQLPVIALGEGSNILLAGDINGLVLRQRSRGTRLLAEDDTTVTVRVAAGENWHRFVCWALQAGYFGLENLALIPGTVGAAPIQNIGAYGVELNVFVDAVHCISIGSGKKRCLSNAQCAFGYRDSIFKRELIDQVLVTAVDFRLHKRPSLRIEYPALAAELSDTPESKITPGDVFDAVVKIRSSKLPDPSELPNAGSFFKNPIIPSGQAGQLSRKFDRLPRYPQADGAVKLAAAWMIEHCGWKGYREAGVGVHPNHALVLVNYSAVDGDRLLRLAEKIQISVQKTFGVSLDIEPRIYGRAA